MKKWLIPEAPAHNAEMAEGFGGFLGALLVSRGIHTMEQARAFFACGELSDPFALRDMDRAVEMINAAVDEGRRITVYGDYDCDGITATVMLYSYLEAVGAEVDYYIPDRAEGYGMSIDALERIVSSGTELVITVDNGISAIDEALFLKQQGVELVVTDHHQPQAELPECGACVDPHRADDMSHCKELCGAGVVLKLLCALSDGDEEFVMEQYAELAAIGTIGDVMPLTGENRYIVRRGLDNMRTGQNIGLARLLKKAGIGENLTATAVAMSVCPRINAAGRMADAGKAVRLLLAETPEAASLLAEEIDALNTERRNAEAQVLDEVEKRLCSEPSLLSERVLIIDGKGWNHGIVGLVCARLLEKYGKPVFVISVENGVGRGSARGIDGFSVYRLLASCSEVMIKYGGHPKAGGFSLDEGRIGEFRERAYAYCKEHYPKMPVHFIEADMQTDFRQLTLDNLELLARLEPFGEGNRQPLFLIRDCTVRSKKPLKDGRYVAFELECGGKVLRAVSFRMTYDEFIPRSGDRIDILTVAEINEYNGIRSVSLKVQEVRPSGFSEDRFFAAQRVYEEIARGEGCDKRLLPRVIPDREALKGIYDMIRRDGARMSAENMCVYGGDINYCMLRISLDALSEAGLARVQPNAERCELIPQSHKCDIFSQGLLARLQAESK